MASGIGDAQDNTNQNIITPTTNNGQSGIDILCDAAGSDMLMSSFYAVNPTQHPQQLHHPSANHHQPHVANAQDPAAFAPAGHDDASSLPARQLAHLNPTSQAFPTKRTFSDSTPPASTATTTTHVCHICKRVYERADHLTRHLRSHENARPYQCSRCPKRFNRADLLTRHETTHDRDGAGAKNRSFIRRSDRAAEACIHCSASKSKCTDTKPCTRCRNKNLTCQMPPKRGIQYRTTDVDTPFMSPSDASHDTPGHGTNEPSLPHDVRPLVTGNDIRGSSVATPQMSGSSVFDPEINPGQPQMDNSGLADDAITFFNPVQNPFQDMDFSWNFDFKNFTVPHRHDAEHTPHSNSTSNSKPSSRSVGRDTSRGHAAFKRSPWLWDPEPPTDYINRAKEGLAISNDYFANAQRLHQAKKGQVPPVPISHAARDSLFAMVLNQHTDKQQLPSFPPLDLLNYLLQAHFLQDERNCDSWLHAPSLDPNTVIPELLGGVIASGATYISAPSIWRFGLALQEVVRIAVGLLFEGSNSKTRDLMATQSYMFYLDIGQWCGFNRQMEICEGFMQPMVTMLRRSGKTASSPEPATSWPLKTDEDEMLERKWRSFIKRESYKRLVLHVFIRDAQSSIGLCKNPLMSYNELCFGLPASQRLWRATSAKEWRDACLATKVADESGGNFRVSSMMHDRDILAKLEDRVDADLVLMTLLYGLWGQVAAFRETVKFNRAGTRPSVRTAIFPLWLETQQQELYRHLCEISNLIRSSRVVNVQMLLLAELFMMLLHVSADELQKYAGKNGEDEARQVSQAIEEIWADGTESRYAAWHAGQVLRLARRMQPTCLQGFNVIAVYFAGLALWAYGLCSQIGQGTGMDRPQSNSLGYILLDGEDSHGLREFLQMNQGIPALQNKLDPSAEPQRISDCSAVLAMTRGVLRDNFPVPDEPLPPLVQSLELLLRDLGLDQAGQLSREGSDDSR